jgi:two-component system, chemotaxis family, sensor kinase CheA
MPISPDPFSAIEEVLNRLAVEAVLAAPGRDESLIPIYSLLGEIRTLCAAQPAMVGLIDALFHEFERCLDATVPISAPLVGRLRVLVEWLPDALEAWRHGVAMPPAVPAEICPPSSAADSPDALLEIDLGGESRELLTEFYGEALEHLQQIEAALLALERSFDDAEALNSIFRSFHTIKGNAGFLGLAPMNLLAHEVESLLDLARNRRLRLNSAIITEILRSRDALQALIDQVGRALKTGQVPDRIVPIRQLIQSVRQLTAGSAEPVAAIPPAGPGEPAAAEAIAPASAPDEAAPAPATAERSAEASRTVRVATEKLDSLMDVVGELVIVQSQLIETAHRSGAADGSLQRDVAQLNRIAKELQRTAMGLRMIPIKPAFQKMERLARDLACAEGKKVDFVTSGEGTELDRTVVEEIGDPLVHMVRNALDHGLETPAERLAQGKPEVGALRLRAYHEGGSVIVELRDDGRGIDPAKVLAKAKRLGLVAADVQLGREEAYGLIFLPGFSTAEQITSVSGRGVGMDVVKRNIERLRGKIEVDSEVGRGTVFKIKLPLTLAIIDGLVVRVGDDRFILPSTSVQMALRPVRQDVVRVQGCGEVLDWHGRLLPLHRLHRHFGIPARAKEPWDGIVVIVESSGKLCALLVDEMISKQEVVIKSLGAFLQGLAGVSGGAILGDGRIALILDPATLLQAA